MAIPSFVLDWQKWVHTLACLGQMQLAAQVKTLCNVLEQMQRQACQTVCMVVYSLNLHAVPADINAGQCIHVHVPSVLEGSNEVHQNTTPDTLKITHRL